MATKTVQIDDMDRTSEATHIGVRLTLNEVSRQLDLSDEHWNELNDLLAPYLRAGIEYTAPEPPAKRKLSHDERNSLLSWARNVEHIEVKRVTPEIVSRWEQYIAERDAKLLTQMDDRIGEHASEEAINAAIAAGEASTQDTEEKTPTSSTRRTRQKA